MHKKPLAAAFVLGLAALSTGCGLFAPRPVPPARPNHVIIVGIDGLKPGDISPDRTPHLYRMQHDGAYTWKLVVRNPHSRLATYTEALDTFGSTIFERCRARGLGAAAIVRSPALKLVDNRAVLAKNVSVTLDNPEAVATYAAARWLADRPACLFVELSAGKEPVERSDAALAKLHAAVERAGLVGRTTFIVMSATGPPRCWMIRGPGTRHGHEIAARLTAAGTGAAAAHLILPGATGARRDLFPAAAFHTYSREATSKGEREVPRGSIRGRVLSAAGRAMPRASVLLVKMEPVDGITERRADAGTDGRFRFDSIPAGTYDYVFVFDNLPARLRRSLLVAKSLTVKRDTTTAPVLRYRRMQGSDRTAPAMPPAEAMTFLTDRQVARLRRAARSGAPMPLLAADALTGRRVRTPVIRTWLLVSAARVTRDFQRRPLAPGAVNELIDLAAAYNVNRGNGLLNNTEDRDVRTALNLAGSRVAELVEQRDLPPHARTDLALALTMAAIVPRPCPKDDLEPYGAWFRSRLDFLAARAEHDPATVDHDELSAALAAAMVYDALGCDGHVDKKLRRLTKLVAASLTPAERRVLPDGPAKPAATLGFLGLAKSAFADERLGERCRGLWAACGSPVWTPRGNESVLGPLLTAAAEPRTLPAAPARSAKLTDTTAVLTHAWGTPGEWLVHVNGWSVDVHARGAKLTTLSTDPRGAWATSQPKIVRFKASPACDYVLLKGFASGQARTGQAVFRHVLFNKLTGYVVVSDEFPAGARLTTEARAASALADGRIEGERGRAGQVLSIAARAVSLSKDRSALTFASTSSRPTFVVYCPPAGSKATAKLGTWDVTRTSLAEPEQLGFGGVHLVLAADRGREFIRIARQPAHVADNLEDNLLQGSVGLVRRGAKSTDLVLVRADWAQVDELFFALDDGQGYVTIHEAGRAEGWARCRHRPRAKLFLGEDAPATLRLQVDGKRRRLTQDDDRATFRLPAGPHAFRIE